MLNRSVLTAAFAVGLVALGTSQAFAQIGAGATLRADIPFEFAAGAAKMPAGQYTIRPASGTGQPLLSLRGEEQGPGAFVLTNSAYSVTAPDQSKLVFHKYGDQYFLSEIWVEGQGLGWQVPASRSERELGRRAANDAVVTILARR